MWSRLDRENFGEVVTQVRKKMRMRKQNAWKRINALLPDLKERKQNAWSRRNALLSDLREQQCRWVDDRKSRRSLAFNQRTEERVSLGIQECFLLGFPLVKSDQID